MSGIAGPIACSTLTRIGTLSGTMTASGSSGNTIGYSKGFFGVVTATVPTLGQPSAHEIVGLVTNTFTTKFIVTINDPDSVLPQNAFTQITMGGNTFLTALATFLPSVVEGGAAIWQWTDGSGPSVGTGKTYAIV